MTIQKRVILSAGHDPNIDPGAVGQGSNEGIENVQLVNRAAGLLQGWGGLEVVVMPHDVGGLVNEINWVNNHYHDLNDALAIQIHKNAGGGTGSEVWYPSHGDDVSINNAQIIDNAIAAATGQRNRGIKDASTNRWGKLGWTDDTVTYALLIETGFIDVDPLDDNADVKYATGIATGIMQVFGVPIPVPNPAPVIVAPVVVPPAPVVTVNPFTKFETPMNLVVNKIATNVYDITKAAQADLDANIVKTLPVNESFIAYGKYKHPIGSVFFMTEYSFGQADTTGKCDHPYGVNTIDLSPAPAITETPVTEPTPETTVTGTPTDVPTTDDGSVVIPVTVIPVDPLKWQKSYVDKAGEFIAIQSAVIKDMAGVLPDIQLVRGQQVHVAGTFEKDGVKYYRTRKGLIEGTWYGIPEHYNSISTLTESDDAFSLPEEIATVTKKLTAKQHLIRIIATVVGVVQRILKGSKKI